MAAVVGLMLVNVTGTFTGLPATTLAGGATLVVTSGVVEGAVAWAVVWPVAWLLAGFVSLVAPTVLVIWRPWPAVAGEE